MNPLLDRKYFIPDGEAHVMPDGRIYLYGSKDELGNSIYCSKQYRVFSCDNVNLEDWKDHGISFENTAENGDVPWGKDKLLFAPDAIYNKGKYYLYFCTNGDCEGVAVADKPEGPFKNAQPIKIADGDSIDPAIFVDDDGSVYYFWGQFHLRGAKLKEDMCTIDESTLTTSILTEQEHGFHEGSSVRKRNGKYYIVYADISRGRATCLSYAMSDNPLGPYKKCGTIIDNIYCDPQTWNNHGSIECYKDQWFVFYHRTTQNNVHSRRACAEPIFFNEDGTINEVEMTTNGASAPLNAFMTIDASLACRMKGNLYIETKINDSGIEEILTNVGGGNWTRDWAEYKYLDFSGGASKCRITVWGEGTVCIMTHNGVICGECKFKSDKFETFEFEVSSLADQKQAVWFLFDGKNIKFKSFGFVR